MSLRTFLLFLTCHPRHLSSPLMPTMRLRVGGWRKRKMEKKGGEGEEEQKSRGHRERETERD